MKVGSQCIRFIGCDHVYCKECISGYLNVQIRDGAVSIENQKYRVNFEQLEESIRNLVRKICTLQHNGDKEAVDQELDTLGVLDDTTQDSLDKLSSIPVDIRPCYPLAGEKC